METKKLIELKKGGTIRDLFIMIILAVGAFGMITLFANQNLQDAGVTINNSFNDSYNKMLESQTNTTKYFNEMRNATGRLSEATIGEYAYFGIKGVVTLMTLPIAMLSVAGDLYAVFELETPVIPDPIKYAGLMIILIIILFSIIKFATNRGVEA